MRGVIIWMCVLCLRISPNSSEELIEDEDVIAFTQVSDQAGQSMSRSNMPETLDLNFPMANSPVTLNLTLNHHVHSNAPVYVGRRGQMMKYHNYSTDNFGVYTDFDKNAAFIVRNVDVNGQQQRTYKGSFRVGLEEYVLEPISETSVNLRRRRRSVTLGEGYLIYKQNQTKNMFEQDNIMRDDINAEFTQYQDNIGLIGNAPSGKQYYEVEMFLFVDYAIFNRWFQRSKKIYYENREREAIDNIRYYFSHVVNGIDLRYKSIQEPDYSISVILKGFFIATTPSDSPWTERYPNKEYGYPRDFANAHLALNDFEAWLNQTKQKLPPFDQATLYTGHILFNGRRSDGSHRPISGLADIQGVCSYYSAAVNQDAGLYASMQNGAHELGHNLGSQHDNPVFNWCEGRDQYIMATSPGELTDNNYKNAFTFSPCSRRSFREFLLFLTMQKKNCLLNIQNYGPDQKTGLESLPGRRYTLDEQCQDRNGFHSYYCGGHLNDQNMCRKILCFVPELNKCTDHTEQRAYDGTTCGNRKWCEGGDCVYDGRAPPTAEFCMTGDFLGRFYDGKKCSEVIRDEPWKCYESVENYDKQCCQSCLNIKDETNEGCEFGDHDDCENIRIKTPFDCYKDVTRRKCCKTCEKIAREKTPVTPECIYGDKASWCRTLEKGRCYREGNICCEKCEALRQKDNPECPWGDQASWCSSLTQAMCYNNKEKCCGRCRPWGPPRCEFGDKRSGCRQSDCTDSYNRDKCCHTCGTYTYDSVTTRPNTITTTASLRPADPGCVDRANWCSSMPDRDCYVSKDTCCATCRQRVKPRAASNCMYGDHVNWCGSYVRSADYCKSPDIKMSCCMTCDGMTSTITTTTASPSGCVDKASWCATMPRSYCYTSASTCCARCSRERTGPSGCEYGDHYTWCPRLSSSQCAANKQKCCSSC